MQYTTCVHKILSYAQDKFLLVCASVQICTKIFTSEIMYNLFPASIETFHHVFVLMFGMDVQEVKDKHCMKALEKVLARLKGDQFVRVVHTQDAVLNSLDENASGTAYAHIYTVHNSV